jgi:hypothetical protein
MDATLRTAFTSLALSTSLACGGDVIITRTGDAATPNDIASDSSTIDAAIDSAPDAQTCAQLQVIAANAYVAVIAGADFSCGVDSDCAFSAGAYGADDCFACCGSLLANGASAASIGAATSALCSQLADEGCAVPQCEVPCAVAPTPTCLAGTCVGTYAFDDAGVDASPTVQSCDALEGAAGGAWRGIVAANQSCSANADCVAVPANCLTPCEGLVTNVASVQTVNAEASLLCQQLADAGCPLSTEASCVPTSVTVECENGYCTQVLDL